MSLYLVRHGETVWTRQGRHTGKTDIPLTEAGEEQARQLSHRLREIAFSRALSSPRQRAFRTAELARVQPQMEVTPLLAEWDYGDYEGLTTEEISAAHPGWDLWRDGCPGGESAEQMVDRGGRLLSELNARDGEDLVLFGHADALRALAAAYLGHPPEICHHLTLNVASISILGWRHQWPAIICWNLT